MKAKWIGTSGILPMESEVDILGIDYEGCDVTARAACWIRHRPDGCERFLHRSCDLGDLVIMPDEPDTFRSEPTLTIYGDPWRSLPTEALRSTKTISVASYVSP